jgi:hypothetical protein
MAAPRRGRPAKINSQAEQLSKALAFVSLVSDDDETFPSYGYVKLGGNMAICYSRVFSAGHPIEEDLDICPNLERVKLALSKTGKTLTIAKTPGGQLSISGEKFRALVPSIAVSEMPTIQPDPPCAVIDDRIKQAFKVCGLLASENAEKVHEASLLLEAYVCTGTNGVAMLQFMHGIDLPPNIIISKAFAAAVAKVEYALTGFGFSWNNDLNKPGTVTFWFDNGSWIKCNCYSDKWPDIEPILSAPNSPVAVPAGLFEAVEAVEKFSDEKEASVFFTENKVQSHYSNDAGASYDVKGLPGGKRFRAKLMRQVAPYCSHIDLTSHGDRAFFTGGDDKGPVRGVIMGMTGAHPPVSSAAPDDAPEATGTGWGGAEITGDDEPPVKPWGAEDEGENAGFNH